MTTLKRLGLAVGALALLLMVVVGIAALLIDPNDYKASLQRAVEQRTGRRLQLEGDLRLAWFPWLAIEFGPASLGNAAGFGAEPLLQVQRARLGLRVAALLQRRLEFDTLRVEQPLLRLAVDAGGRDNWTGLAGTPAADAGGAAPGRGIEVSFSSIRIADGRVEYRDARDGAQIELAGLALETGRLQPGTPFDLHAAFDWRSEPDASIAVVLDGRATVDVAADRYRLEEPRIGLRLRGPSWPAAGIPVDVRSGPIELDLAAQTLRMPALQAESLGARLSGDLAGRGMPASPRLSGPLRLEPMSPRDWLRRAGVELPPRRDAEALTALSFDGQLAATPESVGLTSLRLRLDGTTVTGSASIADLDAEAIRFDLVADRLDLDRYLAPKGPAAGVRAAQAAEVPQAVAGLGEPAVRPVERIRDLDLAGQLLVQRASVAGVALTGLKLGLEARAAKLRLFPLEAALYGGRYRGDLRVDASGEAVRVDFDETVTAIDFAPLFRDLFDSGRMTGRGDGRVSGTARGTDLAALLGSADGQVRLKVADGAIEGADLWYEIRRARALLRREPAPARPAGAARTPFTRLQATGRLGGGTLRSDDVAMDLQYLRVAGRGGIDLVARTVDWNLDATVLEIPDAEAAMPEVVDFTVPVRVTGPIDDPVVRPDLAGLAKARVKEEVEKRRGDVEKKVKDTLRDLLGR
jgi:AsmA protein